MKQKRENDGHEKKKPELLAMVYRAQILREDENCEKRKKT